MIRPKADKLLASEVLAQAPEILDFVERTYVSALRAWLLRDLDRPLLCIGNGGKHTSYPELLYGISGGIARTLTPLEFSALSVEAIRRSKILLLSSAGNLKCWCSGLVFVPFLLSL